MDDTERPKSHPASLLCDRQRRIQAVEIRTGDAASLAWTAVVTSRAPAMVLSQNCAATDGQHALTAKMPGHLASDKSLDTIQFHRGKEPAVTQLRESQGLARNADKIFHIVVPRCNVGIANGPIDGDS